MQMPDLNNSDVLGAPMLEEIRLTAQRRLREIEPLIEEAERLRDVIALIEERSVLERPREGVESTREADPAARRSALRAQIQPRAAKGANKRLILQLVGERPGITPAEIALTTGLKRTVVASTVSRLKRHGELRNHERGGVCLPGARRATPALG
jgi:hypothetical protein